MSFAISFVIKFYLIFLNDKINFNVIGLKFNSHNPTLPKQSVNYTIFFVNYI
jgi:hypothetical protein